MSKILEPGHSKGANDIQDALSNGVPSESSYKSFNSAIRNIGQYGQISKSVSRLSADETLTLKGKYSTDEWRFSIVKYVVILLIVVGVGSLLVLVYKRNKNKLNNNDKNSNQPPSADVTKDSDVINTDETLNTTQSNEIVATSYKSNNSFDIRAVPLYSFFSRLKRKNYHPSSFAIIIVLASFALIIISYFGLSVLTEVVDGRSSGDMRLLHNTLIPILIVLLTVFVVTFYIFLIFISPAIYYGGVKKALWSYLYIFIFYVILTIGVVALAIFTDTNQQSSPSYRGTIEPTLYD